MVQLCNSSYRLSITFFIQRLTAYNYVFFFLHIKLKYLYYFSTYFLPWMTLNLWKFEFRVIWIHFAYLFSCRCAQNFDDLNQLIDTRIAGENWLAE